MAIYEYYSPDNNRIYSFYAKTISLGAKLPRCPDNPKFGMVKMISSFSVTSDSGNSEEEISAANLNDPNLQVAMAEMESEMMGIDEENPDPRQLGRLMRKMTELSGEKMPGRMEEIMRRLEAGEDTEKLEEMFGDILDDEDDALDASSEKSDNLKNKKRKRISPTRDPILYNLSDYI